MADDLALDLQELSHLQSIAKRPNVISFIASEIRKIEKQLSDMSVAVPQSTAPIPTPTATPIPTPIPTPRKVLSDPAIQYVTLSSFSWDQDNEKVKIYLFLEGVEQDKVETTLKQTSVDIKLHDVQGKNYRCAIPNLNKEIIPEKSTVVVKPKKVILNLFKESRGNWLELHAKPDKLKPNLDKSKDPMAGIMDLMKNMYEDGDDEMKKTIAKAWTDARSGKTTDPLAGYKR